MDPQKVLAFQSASPGLLGSACSSGSPSSCRLSLTFRGLRASDGLRCADRITEWNYYQKLDLTSPGLINLVAVLSAGASVLSPRTSAAKRQAVARQGHTAQLRPQITIAVSTVFAVRGRLAEWNLHLNLDLTAIAILQAALQMKNLSQSRFHLQR